MFNEKSQWAVLYQGNAYGPFPDSAVAQFWAERAVDDGVIDKDWELIRIIWPAK